MSIGQRIRNRRIELGLSQSELGERLGGISKAAVSAAELDKKDMTTDRIRRYAEALETTPAYLMGWEKDYTVDIRSNLADKAFELWTQYEGLTPEQKIAFENYLKFLQSQS